MAETENNNGALVKKDEALVGAAVSAAVGMAVYGLRKALAERRRDDHGDDAPLSENGHSDSWLVMVWESASDSLLPLVA
jgi:hypothetical protein